MQVGLIYCRIISRITICHGQEAGVTLTDEEIAANERVFNETIANEFPDEDMLDKTFRDKVVT